MYELIEDSIDSALTQAESWSAEEVLRWTSSHFAEKVAIASAFGVEGIVLIDLASKVFNPLRIFTLDTGFFFPETQQLITTVELRYGITVERVEPLLTPEVQEQLYGPSLWQRNPNLCCQLRKIEPLRAKLASVRAWVTAIRRSQTSTRAQARKLEWDTKFLCWKINPLVDWTEERVWDYVRRHRLPYNPLHDQHYPSVGCFPCTRAIRPGEGARDGRWAGSSKTECGLHDHAENTADTLTTAPGSTSQD